MIVDEPYTVNECYGEKLYSVTVDSPDYNQPLNHYYANCKVNNTKRIAEIRQRSINIARAGRSSGQEKFVKVEL